MVQSNANVNSQDYNGCTPLVISILEGQDEECVELLCKLGADVNCTVDKLHGYCPLHFAAEKNMCDIIKILIQYGASRNCQTFTGCTPLHLAAMHGNLEAVRILCLNSADVNVPEWYNGYIPLHYAIIHEHLRVVFLLLEFNASLALANFSGYTALNLSDKELHKYLYYLKTEPKVLEKICLDVVRKNYLWPNAYQNVSKLPLPLPIKKKILFE